MEAFINFFYIISVILLVYGIKMLGSAETARQGNRLSAIGMLVAVVVTLIDQQIFTSWYWIAGGLLIGGAIGAAAASRVEMTGMPEQLLSNETTTGISPPPIGITPSQPRASDNIVPAIKKVNSSGAPAGNTT